MPLSYTGNPASASAERTNPTESLPADGDAGAGSTFQPSLKGILDEIAALKQKVAYLDAAAAFTAALSTNSGLTVSAGGAAITGASSFSGGTVTLDPAQTVAYSSTRTRRFIISPASFSAWDTVAGTAQSCGNHTALTDPPYIEMNQNHLYNVMVPLHNLGLPLGTTITSIDMLIAGDISAGGTHLTPCGYWIKAHDYHDANGSGAPSSSSPTYYNASGAGGDTFNTPYPNTRDWVPINLSGNIPMPNNTTSVGTELLLYFFCTPPGGAFNPTRIYGLRFTYTVADAIEQAV